MIHFSKLINGLQIVCPLLLIVASCMTATPVRTDENTMTRGGTVTMPPGKGISTIKSVMDSTITTDGDNVSVTSNEQLADLILTAVDMESVGDNSSSRHLVVVYDEEEDWQSREQPESMTVCPDGDVSASLVVYRGKRVLLASATGPSKLNRSRVRNALFMNIYRSGNGRIRSANDWLNNFKRFYKCSMRSIPLLAVIKLGSAADLAIRATKSESVFVTNGYRVDGTKIHKEQLIVAFG